VLIPPRVEQFVDAVVERALARLSAHLPVPLGRIAAGRAA